jgi:hypothetical protein
MVVRIVTQPLGPALTKPVALRLQGRGRRFAPTRDLSNPGVRRHEVSSSSSPHPQREISPAVPLGEGDLVEAAGALRLSSVEQNASCVERAARPCNTQRVAVARFTVTSAFEGLNGIIARTKDQAGG